MDGIDVVRLPERYHLFEAPIIPQIALAALKEDYDILHVHGTVPSISDLTLIAGHLRRKPKVITYHYDAVTPKYGLLGRLSGVVYALLARPIVKLAEAIVATTRSYAKTSSLLRDIGKKIVIIPCGVDTDRFLPSQSQRNKKAGSSHEGRRVLYVGKLIHYKGVNNLIKAFRLVIDRCPNCRLAIVGNGEQRDELIHLVNELQLDGEVTFLGDLPDSQLPQQYQESDVLVLPSLESRREAFGMVLLEAMSCGIPVIVSDIPGPDEVVHNAENGFLAPPGDIPKLAEAMIKILNDPHRHEIGARIRADAKAKYDWSVIAAKYEDLYQSLLQGQPHGN
jgi:rhamnosyl/mannosyltransferase